jgi:hypothetical protein
MSRHTVIAVGGEGGGLPVRKIVRHAPSNGGRGAKDRLADTQVMMGLRDGQTVEAIAAETGMTPTTVEMRSKRLQHEIATAGMAVAAVDREALGLAVAELLKLLEDGDKDAVFQTLRGRGVFRQYVDPKDPFASTPVALRVEVTMPAGLAGPTTVAVGAVMGCARADVGEEEAIDAVHE